MIAQETFVKIISAIKEQEEINRKVGDALNLVCNGHFVFGTDNKEHEALLLLLRVIFKDNEDFIGWWLYETSEPVVKEKVRDKECVYDLSTPEALYDFLIKNMKEGTEE